MNIGLNSSNVSATGISSAYVNNGKDIIVKGNAKINVQVSGSGSGEGIYNNGNTTIEENAKIVANSQVELVKYMV